jgi:recombinational DNA repair ATPase RecF
VVFFFFRFEVAQQKLEAFYSFSHRDLQTGRLLKKQGFSLSFWIKITELLYLTKKTKKNPVFLIDDLFASLDEKKSKKLLAFVGQLQTERKKRPQTIITTTDFVGPEKNGLFLGFEEVKKHHIHKNGNT